MKHQPYMNLRREAEILRDEGNYDRTTGQTNPVIFENCVELLIETEGLPPVLWDPFFGHLQSADVRFELCDEIGVKLIAHDIASNDERVFAVDSTKVGPSQEIGGIIFHPPYFGSLEFSDKPGEISLVEDLNTYILLLSNALRLGVESLCSGGVLCGIARRYRHLGKEIRLDEIFLDIFYKSEFSLFQVWSSEPDVILVLRHE